MEPRNGGLYCATGEVIFADSGTENETMYHQISVQPHTQSLRSGHALVASYLELAKARLATLVVLTTVVGHLLAARGGGSFRRRAI